MFNQILFIYIKKHSQTLIQQQHQIESKSIDFPVCSVNVGTFKGQSGEIAEMLEHRSIDICYVQDARFRGMSVRIVSEKTAEYKLFSIGNEKDLVVGMLLAKKCINKIINISRGCKRM